MVAIFQAGRGRDSYIKACARVIWLAYTIHGVTLTFLYTPVEQLVDTADALSHFHKGRVYQDMVHELMKQGVRIITFPDNLIHLSADL